jgi:Leucine-rich repeat (LRR) protein
MDSLAALEILDLSFNQLEDISAVAACTSIKELNISDNTITDIKSLASLENLAEFNFSRNSVTELPEFSKDSALVTIDCSHNNIKALTSLSGLKSLNNVFMDYNPKLSSIKPLTDCRRLVQVKVYGTKVKDVTALLEMDVLVEFDPTLAM